MEIDNELWSDLTNLTSEIGADTFKDDILRVLNRLMGVDHFAVFVFERDHIESVTTAMLEGESRKSVLAQNASVFIKKLKQHLWLSPELFNSGGGGQEYPYPVYRYSPDDDGNLERKQLYKNSHICEKIFMVTSKKYKIYITDFFRDGDNSKLSHEEFNRVKLLLPIFNNLIILRHELCGMDGDKHKIQSNLATQLKERGAKPFSGLSRREAEVCDGILQGMKADGIATKLSIAVSTVTTLRQRAYNKVGITSKAQLFAIAINHHI